jgi:hypothetical protein
MRVIDSSGRFLDAQYLVEPDGGRLALILESRGGRPARNSEYNPALTLLLTRLAALDAVLADALVDSDRTRHLPEADRRITSGPVWLAAEPDLDALRRRLGTAQAKVAQAPAATGGNSNRRIRLRLDVPAYHPADAGRLADAIAVPARELAATPDAILERLPPASTQPPTEDDYAAAAALAADLDKVTVAIHRVEQAYLRRILFPGPAGACDLCGRRFSTDFLVAAHIKKRSACTDAERRDVTHIAMAACRFGCDELFERGYITVAENGTLVISLAVQRCDNTRAYAAEHFTGRKFARPMDGRGDYFAWHRTRTYRN